MTYWVLLGLLFTGAQNAPPLGAPTRPNTDVVARMEAALRADPEWARHHRGYLELLAREPGLASAEEAFSELAPLTGFGRVVRDFDEALVRNPAAEARCDRYYEALAEDDALRNAVDMLFRWELDQRRTGNAIPTALEHLRAAPDKAILFLRSPSRLGKTPPELLDFLPYLKQNPDAREDLLALFVALQENPRVHKDVLPWWQMLATPLDPVAESHRRMHAYLIEHPSQFWVWHRREIALASNPHARDWIRYWRRRVRRGPELAAAYDVYLKRLRENPESQRRETDERMDARDNGPVWPPEGPPPPLPPLPGESVKPERPLKQDLKPEYPRKPSVEYPGRPAMPQMPTMPERPSRPTPRTAEPHKE